MPTPQLGSLNPNATLDELKDYLVGLNRYLNYLLSSLDTLNISRLDAKVIIAQTITALQIAANTITADKMNVTELSAITANMGTLTAGSITTNAEINVGTDCRVGNNLYVGQATTNDKVIYLNGAEIKSIFGADSLSLQAAGIVTVASLDTIVLSCLLGNVGVQSQHGTIADIVQSINNLTSSISSLSSALSGKVDSGSFTSTTAVSDGHNHGIPNGTLLAVSGGGSVTWASYAGSAGHSHSV